MERSPINEDVVLQPATVEDYNEMGRRISTEEIAAVEAESLAFKPPEDWATPSQGEAPRRARTSSLRSLPERRPGVGPQGSEEGVESPGPLTRTCLPLAVVIGEGPQGWAWRPAVAGRIPWPSVRRSPRWRAHLGSLLPAARPGEVLPGSEMQVCST